MTALPLSDLEPMPAAAAAIFGTRLPLARRYVELLATAGVERGLLGPRERPRLWTRHVLNSAVVAAALPGPGIGAASVSGPGADSGAAPAPAQRVVDVGSGAGLPGIPLALARPDLSLTLLEPLARRVAFLDEVVADLELPVTVQRGRAEDVAEPRWDVAVARAVAPLERLLAMASRLVQAGGMLVAVKGRTAAAEIEAAQLQLHRHSSRPAEILTVGAAPASATVIRVHLDRPPRRAPGRRAALPLKPSGGAT